MELQKTPHRSVSDGLGWLRISRALFCGTLCALVAACGGGGGSEPVGALGACGIATPNACNAAVGPDSITLTWDASTDPNHCGYRIYYGNAPRSYLQPFGQGVNVGTATSCTVSGLASGTYYGAVTSVDNSNFESVYSVEVVKVIP